MSGRRRLREGDGGGCGREQGRHGYRGRCGERMGRSSYILFLISSTDPPTGLLTAWRRNNAEINHLRLIRQDVLVATQDGLPYRASLALMPTKVGGRAHRRK